MYVLERKFQRQDNNQSNLEILRTSGNLIVTDNILIIYKFLARIASRWDSRFAMLYKTIKDSLTTMFIENGAL